MNSNRIHRSIGGVLIGLFLLLGIAVASGSTVQAQYPWGRDGQDRRDRDDRRNRDWGCDDRNRRGYGYDIYRIAQNQGYEDGLNTGANDARRGQSFDPQRSHFYKNATDGYNSSYGNRDAYKQAFRNGFLSGYHEGYRRYGGNRRRNDWRRFPFPW